MKRISRLTADQREDLVAYLDGELGERETATVEETLAESEVARREVDMLSRTWDLLEELPRITASSQFSTRTISSIQLEDVSGRVTDRPWFKQVRRGAVVVTWLVFVCLSAVGGFFLTNRWIPNDVEAIARDYSVIENFHIYQQTGVDSTESSSEFIDQLWKSGHFNESIETEE